MNRTRHCVVLLVLAALSSAYAAPATDQPNASPYKLSDDQIHELMRLRDEARSELIAKGSAAFQDPDIIGPLLNRSCIAIVTTTAINATRKPVPYLLLTVHVEQVLRDSDCKSDFQAYARWQPPPSSDEIRYAGGPPKTALDISEPKVGNRYLLGFSFVASDGTAYVPGAIDSGDSDFLVHTAQVRKVLDIDSAEINSSFAPYIAALADETPWIRDFAAYRLTSSGLCEDRTPCVNEFMVAIGRLLESSNPNERLEAVRWLDSAGTATFKASAYFVKTSTAYLKQAIRDSNLAVGDEAFVALEMQNFDLPSHPGECILIVPALRKHIPISSDSRREQQFQMQFPYTQTCMPKN
jgi:hypothetical protein